MTYETQEMNGYIAFYIDYAIKETGKVCIVHSTDGGFSFPDGTFLTNMRLRIEIDKRIDYWDFIDANKFEPDSLYEIRPDSIYENL
tara:strand:+ start:318 stop:575 length:258 start_codon:yes stop_codon:yes gene_type:complete